MASDMFSPPLLAPLLAIGAFEAWVLMSLRDARIIPYGQSTARGRALAASLGLSLCLLAQAVLALSPIAPPPLWLGGALAAALGHFAQLLLDPDRHGLFYHRRTRGLYAAAVLAFATVAGSATMTAPFAPSLLAAFCFARYLRGLARDNLNHQRELTDLHAKLLSLSSDHRNAALQAAVLHPAPSANRRSQPHVG